VTDIEFVAALAEGFLTVTSIPFVAAVLFRLLMEWLGDIG